jgi:putative endonuclease
LRSRPDFPASDSTTLRGRSAETAAEHYLMARGLVVLQRNYRCSGGEIDLVMRDGATTVFVEVRYRRSDQFGAPADTIDYRKRLRVINCARRYLQVHQECACGPCRFDAVLLSGAPAQDARIEWIKDAFQA